MSARHLADIKAVGSRLFPCTGCCPLDIRLRNAGLTHLLLSVGQLHSAMKASLDGLGDLVATDHAEHAGINESAVRTREVWPVAMDRLDAAMVPARSA